MGSSSDVPVATREVAGQPRMRATRSAVYLRAALLAAAMMVLFRFNLLRLWQRCNPLSGDPEWGHALLVPLVSLAYLYMHQGQLRRMPARPARLGLLVLGGGILLFAYGICIASTFPGLSGYAQDAGMIVTLFGAVLAIFGYRVARIAAFPIAYLFCAVPWPPTFHDQITRPLQNFAATASVAILQCTNLNVEQLGNTIHIFSADGSERVLNVAEACSGMRSLILFLAAGLAVAFLSARPMWQKITLSVAAIPIAVGANVMRIVGEGLLDRYVSQKLSEGFYHSFVGIVLLAPGLLMFAVVGWMLNRIVVREKRVGDRRAPVARESVINDPPPAVAPSGRPVGGMYVIVVSMLAVAAGVFSVTANVLQLHFQKVPVALVKPLADVPAELGRWRQVSLDRPIPADIQATLGTDHYIFRDYVDESLAGRQTVDDVRIHPETEHDVVAALAAMRPAALVHASVTYYTGQVDSVSHVPEVCYVAGGISSAAHSEQAHWIVAGRPLDVRLVRVDSDPSRGSGGAQYVAYCFRVNGRDESENWKVRRSLMNVFERQAYYAKIEVMTPAGDAREAQRVLNDFLSSAMPEIEKCLPSRVSSEAGKP